MFWDVLERVVKIVGICVGAVTIVGVWLTVRDLNEKEADKQSAEWQLSVVYDLIDQNPKISMKALSPLYVTAAQARSKQIPNDKINDDHLRLAILNLMQANAIVQEANGAYSSRREVDEDVFASGVIKGMEASLQKQDSERVTTSKYLLLAAELVRQQNGKLSEPELQAKLNQIGGTNTDFISRHFFNLMTELFATGRISESVVDGKLYYGAFPGIISATSSSGSPTGQ